MSLITIIIFGSGFVLGWIAHKNKETLKKWMSKKLKYANEKTKDL